VTFDGRRPIMSEVRFAVGDADAGLQERLNAEISAFNAVVTGHRDGRLLSAAARGDDGDLQAGLYRWTWGGCGYIDLLWVRPHAGLSARPRRHPPDQAAPLTRGRLRSVGTSGGAREAFRRIRGLRPAAGPGLALTPRYAWV
jgi:hypothetical protein